MKQTIEERGKAIAERSSAETQAEKEYYYAGYVLGATEQKAIDDKEKEELINLASKRIADVEASRSRLLQRREHIIDKACEWLYEQMGSEKFVARFRKTMEE